MTESFSLRPGGGLFPADARGEDESASAGTEDLSPKRAGLRQTGETEIERRLKIALQYTDEYEKDKSPETRKKAVEAFKEAIRIDGKAASERIKGESPTVRSVYYAAVFELNREKGKEKKEKGWFAKNWVWLVPAVIGVAAGIEYAVGDPLHIFTKKEETIPPPPADVTIALDAYNSIEGFQKDLPAITVKEGSAVAIKISGMGVTGVDTKYIAVYSEDFKTKISFDSDGEANFTAPTTDVKYHMITFDELGINSLGQQVSYDWVSDASLQNGKRNHVVYRRDFDRQTMEERVWGGEPLPEIGGKNGVFGQLNDILNVGYTVWGHIDRQPTATTGDFSYGAGDSDGNDGWHAGSYITVNVAGPPQRTFKQQLSTGPVEIGLNSGRLHAGFHGRNLAVRTNMRLGESGLENSTTADFNTGPLKGAVAMTLSPHQQVYTAQANYSAGKVILGMSGGYDARAGIANVSANIGASLGEGNNVMFGVAGTSGMFGFNVQATQAIKDIGTVGFRGVYTKNQSADFTAFGLDARLDKTPIGPVSIISDYARAGDYKATSVGIGKPLGPGTLSLSLGQRSGTATFVDFRYSCSWSF